MLIDDYRSAIRAKNYSKKTFEAYWPHVVEYLRFCKRGDQWRRPEELDSVIVTSPCPAGSRRRKFVSSEIE